MIPYQLPSWPDPESAELSAAQKLELAARTFGGEKGRLRPSLDHPSVISLATWIAVVHAITSKGTVENIGGRSMRFEASEQDALAVIAHIAIDRRYIKDHMRRLNLVTINDGKWCYSTGIAGEHDSGAIQDVGQYFRMMTAYALQWREATMPGQRAQNPMEILSLPPRPLADSRLANVAQCNPAQFHVSLHELGRYLRKQDDTYALAAIASGEDSWHRIVQRFCSDTGHQLPQNGRKTRANLVQNRNCPVCFDGDRVTMKEHVSDAFRHIAAHAAVLALGSSGSEKYTLDLLGQTSAQLQANKTANPRVQPGQELTAEQQLQGMLEEKSKGLDPGLLQYLNNNPGAMRRVLDAARHQNGGVTRMAAAPDIQPNLLGIALREEERRWKSGGIWQAAPMRKLASGSTAANNLKILDESKRRHQSGENRLSQR